MKYALGCALAVAAVSVVAGCHGDVGIPLTISPTHAPMFGMVDVTITGDLASLGQVDWFSIGENQVIDARWNGSSVTVTVQGSAYSGPTDLVIRGEKGRVIHHNVFTFDPPRAGVPKKWMAFGASFTQGTESSGIDPHTQTHGVAAQVARAAGAYLGLPLFDPQVTPPLQPSDFYPDCTQKPGTGAGVATITDIATDPATNLVDLRRARVDWTLVPRDIAIGGAKLVQIDKGVTDFGQGLIANITLDPTVDPEQAFAGDPTPQIDLVEQADPDLAFSTDLMGNDLDASVIQSDDLHPEKATPLAQARPYLDDIVTRLSKLHGDFFIANLPSLTFVPNVAALKQKRLTDGMDTEASFDAKVKAIDDLTAQYNAALTEVAAGKRNIHIVDFKGMVDELKGGVRVGGEFLSPAKFDGLVSLDGLHLTDTGYALYANRFVDAINAVYGTQIPHVDVEAVHAADALAPSKLRAAGLTCVPPAR